MKTRFFKTMCIILSAVLSVLFCRQAKAATTAARLQQRSSGQVDTTRFQKPGKLKRGKIKKKDEDADENEDGVDDDIRARAHQEFIQKRDPKLNRVPVERLLVARQKRNEFLNNIKHRINNKPQNSPANPLGNSLAPSSPTPGASPGSISGLQWQERGPNNVGGRTRALMFDMGDAANGYKRVIAGGVGGGLWITGDITASPVQWTKVNDFFDNIAISCIAQNPANPLEIYAGTGEGFYNEDQIQGLGVWKSSDGGATWAQLPSSAGFKYINAILVDKNGSVYIAGLSNTFVYPFGSFGVEQSTDGGNTWNNVVNSGEVGADLQMAANGDVYASTGIIYSNGHIYMSDYTVNGANTGNAGTWTNITPAANGVITPGTTNWDRIKLATAPSDANIVYAFFEPDNTVVSSTNLKSVQQYNKSANTWTVKTVPTEAFANGQSWYSIAAAVDPNNSGILYAGSLDAEKSTDGGSTWTQDTHWNYPTSNSLYVHADHHAYVYFPGSSSRLMMGTDGGVFYTANADATPSFAEKNDGYNVTQFYSVALHPTNYNYALAGAQDNGSEKLQGAGIGSSTTATGGDGADVFIDQTNGNIQVTSYVYDQYYVSTNNGASFSGLQHYGNGQFINPTAYDPSTKSLYGGSASGYFYRAENILSPTYAEVAVSGFASANVMAVTVSPITANRVYFGLDNGSVVRVDNAQTGTSLTGTVIAPVISGYVTVSCIAVDTTNEDHILVTYSNYGVTHIIETKNASAATPTWTNLDGNLPDMPVRWAMFYPGDPTQAIIATELGVWTTDLINGTSTVWDPTNTGLANVEVDMLTYRASDRTLAAATHGRGVFTSTLPIAFKSDASLGNLTLTTGYLKHPFFASSVFNYASFVGTAISSDMITPTSTNPNAVITVNGTPVSSGSASQAITLNFGKNLITIGVTSQDGTASTTYTDTLYRALSTNSNLLKLVTSKGVLTPTFSNTTLSYAKAVANNISSITLTGTTVDANATITIGGSATASGTASVPQPLNVGDNVINVLVTAQDGSSKTFVVTVTRAASINANLRSLTTSSGVVSPGFTSSGISYTRAVSNATTSITFKPTAADNTATITVNGSPTASGTSSVAQPLVVGSNVVNIVVTAQDGATSITYSVTVNRAAGPLSVTEPLAANQPAEDGVNVHLGLSPNGDGVNDALVIEGITKYPNNRLQIMSRSGQLIFEAKGYDNATRVFDGHSNKTGKMQVSGTYFYSLDYMVNGTAKHKTGFIVLKY